MRSDVVQCIQKSNDHAGGFRGTGMGLVARRGGVCLREGLSMHSKKLGNGFILLQTQQWFTRQPEK